MNWRWGVVALLCAMMSFSVTGAYRRIWTHHAYENSAALLNMSGPPRFSHLIIEESDPRDGRKDRKVAAYSSHSQTLDEKYTDKRLTVNRTWSPFNVSFLLDPVLKRDEGGYDIRYEFQSGDEADTTVMDFMFLRVHDAYARPLLHVNVAPAEDGPMLTLSCNVSDGNLLSYEYFRDGVSQGEGITSLILRNITVDFRYSQFTCLANHRSGFQTKHSLPASIDVPCYFLPITHSEIVRTQIGRNEEIRIELPVFDKKFNHELKIKNPECDVIFNITYNASYDKPVLTPPDTSKYVNAVILDGTQPFTLTFTVTNLSIHDAGAYYLVSVQPVSLVYPNYHILIIPGRPRKPELLPVTVPLVNTAAKFECVTSSTTMPHAFQETLHYSLYLNDVLYWGNETESTFSFSVTFALEGDRLSCAVTEDNVTVQSDPIPVQPHYGPKEVQIHLDKVLLKDLDEAVLPDVRGDLDPRDPDQEIITLTCAAFCYPPCQVTWQDSPWNVLHLASRQSSGYTNVCTVMNPFGRLTKKFEIPDAPAVQSFRTVGKSSLHPGDSVTLSCVAERKWRVRILNRDLQELPIRSVTKLRQRYQPRGVLLEHSVRLNNLSCHDNGDYFCQAYTEDPLGHPHSHCPFQPYSLLRLQVHCAPVLGQETSWKSLHYSVGEDVVLTAFVDAFPSPDLAWHRQDGSLGHGEELGMLPGDAHRRRISLELSGITEADFGNYTLVAKNIHGDLVQTVEIKKRTTAESPVAVHCYPPPDLSPRTLEVSWRPAQAAQDDVTFHLYIHHHRRTPRSHRRSGYARGPVEVKGQDQCCKHRFRDLLPGSRYEVKVAAVTGSGDVSRFVTAQCLSPIDITQPPPPAQPDWRDIPWTVVGSPFIGLFLVLLCLVCCACCHGCAGEYDQMDDGDEHPGPGQGQDNADNEGEGQVHDGGHGGHHGNVGNVPLGGQPGGAGAEAGVAGGSGGAAGGETGGEAADGNQAEEQQQVVEEGDKDPSEQQDKPVWVLREKPQSAKQQQEKQQATHHQQEHQRLGHSQGQRQETDDQSHTKGTKGQGQEHVGRRGEREEDESESSSMSSADTVYYSSLGSGDVKSSDVEPFSTPGMGEEEIAKGGFPFKQPSPEEEEEVLVQHGVAV